MNCYQKNVQTNHLDSFKATAQYVFDRHVPLKQKDVRCDQVAFVNKNLRKDIMTGSRYEKLLRKANKDFFGNLDVKCVTDNKQL